MKQIQSYTAEKYSGQGYAKVEDGIYRTDIDAESLYRTSLSFVQEPELGEGNQADDISQYPLEDLLEKFCCHITDFYDGLNVVSSTLCCLEFASSELEDVRNLRGIIGKHVYNKELNGYLEYASAEYQQGGIGYYTDH